MCLTNECNGELRKLRAKVIRRDTVLGMPPDPPRFRTRHHLDSLPDPESVAGVLCFGAVAIPGN